MGAALKAVRAQDREPIGSVFAVEGFKKLRFGEAHRSQFRTGVLSSLRAEFNAPASLQIALFILLVFVRPNQVKHNEREAFWV